ncbi:MAG TPA: hypothetical protein VMK31_04885, partial [Sphingomicrobium sp.]|nr:hypothetical protein [Sphingomicrobium sp.]
MAETEAERGGDPDVRVLATSRFRRMLGWLALGIAVVVVIAVVIAWTQRRDIASDIIERELEKQGVEGSFTLDRVGLRTQQISNLSLGDPANPDVTADRVQIQMQVKLNGTIDVYRIVARGVRLRGRVSPDGTVSWGVIDKLLPPPGDDPFRLPDVALDIADSSIALATPWGPIGFAIQGKGNLTGGFKGNFVSSSPRLDTGNCIATNVRGAAAIEIEAQRPHVVGPLTADLFACPASNFAIVEPRLEIDGDFGGAFDSYDASARISSQALVAGDSGLAGLNGRITLAGTPNNAGGEVDLSARGARLGTIAADRTRVKGDYRLSTRRGSLVLFGDYAAKDARLAPSMISGVTGALKAAGSTPFGPVAAAIAEAIEKGAREFDVAGGIRLANFPGTGGVRITDATVRTETGARARLSGGKGMTFKWPSGRLRVDGRLQMAGGGLPTGSVTINQTQSGGMEGVGNFQPYTVNGTRLSLSTLRFRSEPDGATRFSTLANLTGRFPGGRVRNLNVPIDGQVSPEGGILVGRDCLVVSFDFLVFQDLQLGRTRLPICPTGRAIIVQPAGGELRVGGRIASPAFDGRIGSSRLQLDTASILFTQSGLTGRQVVLRIGGRRAPVILNAGSVRANFTDAGLRGTLSNADAVIGTVPIRLTDIDGSWRFVDGRLAIDGNLLVQDRDDPPRFYPLRSNDTQFVLDGDRITATGTLRHPESGTLVTDVSVEHNLETGAGYAELDVPGIRFGRDLQPEELTRLTEGVVALVRGTVQGRGRIQWSESG